MTSDLAVVRSNIRLARGMFAGQVRNLPLDDALFAAGGWRSGLGVLKHLGGWLHVYYSYAFEAEPRHWAQTSWPRGLREEVDASAEYLGEVVRWIEEAFAKWDVAISEMLEGTLGEKRPLHMGISVPLSDIVNLQMQHVAFHLGEFNMLLSIKREEAWEWGEEVEENHIDTFGHGVRAHWMSDEIAAATLERLRLAHDARTAGRSTGTAARVSDQFSSDR
jgi:hypothetical protein